MELSHERFQALGLFVGKTVFVSPREINVFVDDERKQ